MYEKFRLNIDDLHIVERSKHFAQTVELQTRSRYRWCGFRCKAKLHRAAQNFLKALIELEAENAEPSK